ncbi:hypothetical protein QYF36_004472 [Acer negundo]|nr:hypothetical protein QYF36_004472 [Acer negundo]
MKNGRAENDPTRPDISSRTVVALLPEVLRRHIGRSLALEIVIDSVVSAEKRSKMSWTDCDWWYTGIV